MRSLPYDIDFRARAVRTQGWGLGLLSVAGLLWIWFAVLLFTPYDAGYNRSECTARFTSERLHDDDSRCVQERDWPELMALLGASIPFAIAGGVVYTTGKVSFRMAEHLAEVTRLNEAKP